MTPLAQTAAYHFRSERDGLGPKLWMVYSEKVSSLIRGRENLQSVFLPKQRRSLVTLADVGDGGALRVCVLRASRGPHSSTPTAASSGGAAAPPAALRVCVSWRWVRGLG